MRNESVRETFTRALDGLVDQVRADRSILAAILGGSLSHDTVWARSDIDLVLITIDDKKLDRDGLTLSADGVNVHTMLRSRAEFRTSAESAIRNSFWHSFLAKGKLLYSHDPTIADLFARRGEIGERDAQLQLLRAASSALLPLYKAHKWMITRKDLDYTALWILHTATPLARVEVIGARQLAEREVIQQAMKLNPSFFRIIYTDLLNTKKTTKDVQAALTAIDEYLAARARTIFAPITEYLRAAGETRSCTEIDNYFARTFGVTEVVTACEYLADLGVIGKAATAVRLTKRSNVDVQELAFFALEDAMSLPSRPA